MKYNLLFVYATIVTGEIVNRCVNDGEVSLTFDDAPEKYTEGILKILKKENIKATFFVNGYRATMNNRKNWKVLEKIYKDGHTIGTHTYSHPALVKLRDFNVYRELYDNELIIRELTGMRPLLFRPPYFSYSDRILNIANHFSYLTVLGDLDTRDWESQDESAILEKFKNFTGKSFISIQHDNVNATVKSLKKVINEIRLRFKIVSMEKCLCRPVYQEDPVYGPLLV